MCPDMPNADYDESPLCSELLQRLVKELLSYVQAAAFPSHKLDGHEVLLDITLQGHRCLILKLPPTQAEALVGLSPREREVARMIAKGYPNKTIAAVLEISSWTVGTYLRRMFAKLGVHSRAALIASLHQQGLLNETSQLPQPQTTLSLSGGLSDVPEVESIFNSATR